MSKTYAVTANVLQVVPLPQSAIKRSRDGGWWHCCLWR